MAKIQIRQRLRQLSGITLGVLLVVLAVLWIDSHVHERHFVCFPGGDVALGFATDRGNLHWVEYAPWSPDSKTAYCSKAQIPFFYLATLTAIPLLWCLHDKSKAKV